jgi:prophage DNA circulation protein
MMGKTWEELLQPGKLGGVEFDFISTTEEGGHDLDVQDVPGLVGNPIDDRSLKGERHQITGVFIEDDYPDVMNALLVVLRQAVPRNSCIPCGGRDRSRSNRGASAMTSRTRPTPPESS